MFRKRKEPVRDNTESQVTMEQIRRRMVANVAGSEALPHAETGSEAALPTHAITSEFPSLPKHAPSYDSAQLSFQKARKFGNLIAEVNRQASSSKGVGNMLRNSMRWYRAPEEAYWNGVLDSIDHVLSALQAHDAVVRIHSYAIESLQEHTAALTEQVNEISDLPKPHTERSES